MSRRLSTAEMITEEVHALEALGLEALRAEWRRRIGPPPRLRSPELLRFLLAWRIQADAFGGLDAETRRALRATGVPRKAKLQVGTRITREWQGRAHVAEVTEEGFLYEGARYDSLSAVARQITGVRWNGPRFFGLREEAG